MDGWDNFFVAMAGAAVAFAGLVLVSISINLERIIKQPGLVGRSGTPLVVLFTIFVASSIILIPDQRVRFYGYELLTLAIVFALVITRVFKGQQPAALQAEKTGESPANSFRFRVIPLRDHCDHLTGCGSGAFGRQ